MKARRRKSPLPTPGPIAPVQLTVTIAPDREGKAAMWVSLRGAEGVPVGPPREVVLDNRLAGFIVNMQALARAKLASLESPAERRTGDSDPTIAVEAAHGEQIRQRS